MVAVPLPPGQVLPPRPGGVSGQSQRPSTAQTTTRAAVLCAGESDLPDSAQPACRCLAPEIRCGQGRRWPPRARTRPPRLPDGCAGAGHRFPPCRCFPATVPRLSPASQSRAMCCPLVSVDSSRRGLRRRLLLPATGERLTRNLSASLALSYSALRSKFCIAGSQVYFSKIAALTGHIGQRSLLSPRMFLVPGDS